MLSITRWKLPVEYKPKDWQGAPKQSAAAVQSANLLDSSQEQSASRRLGMCMHVPAHLELNVSCKAENVSSAQQSPFLAHQLIVVDLGSVGTS
mmetsp:Transcript_4569/g.28964  ORF Transcript_4569/g.28964 Transcript_4569/m.28964 type:complete len:93 (-) Transcript_4569:506-784(-)